MDTTNFPDQLSLFSFESEPESKSQFKRMSDKTYSSFLKERVETYGVNNLMDEELLSLLTGINIEILRKAVDDFGLPDIIKYINSMNITKTQRRKLELINYYHRRMQTAAYKEKPVLNSSSKAGEFCLSLFIGKVYECFYVICLDSQNRVNQAALVHQGTINESPVYPRIIVETALTYRANSIIISHQHPGGSLTPSSSDIEVTKRISEAMNAISIKLVDHVIVAEDRYTSFAEKGLI